MQILQILLMGNTSKLLFTVVACLIQIKSNSSLKSNIIPNNKYQTVSISRNSFIKKVIVLPTATIATWNSKKTKANAASPMKVDEADSISARIERTYFRPKVPKVLRQKIDKDFAVLLMRSSYNALDQLDCVAMDQFQRDFFLLRQAEYLPYVQSLGPGSVKQGELTDPNYFDFISFAQYATISREMSDSPPMIFEEQQGVIPDDNDPDKPMTFIPIIVRRKTEYLDNAKLPIEHDRMVGNAILERFDTVFGATSSALPTFSNYVKEGQRPDAEMVSSALNQLITLFLINGFAYDGSITSSSSSPKYGNATGTKYIITLVSPATIWSGKSLQSRKSKVLNDFLLKTVKVYLARAGFLVLKPSVNYVDNKEITSFTIG